MSATLHPTGGPGAVEPSICASCGAETSADPCEACGGAVLLDGRYRLVGVLGRGARGTTWKAVGPDGAGVAVKELVLGAVTADDRARSLERSPASPADSRVGGEPRPRAASSRLASEHESRRSAWARYEREANVLRTLSHPAIPRLVETFETRNGRHRALVLVLELVRGETLAAEIEHRRYSEEDVLAVVIELCGVLAYLHGLSPPVVHRDVKPANVLRREDGTLALVDFGAVRDALSGTFGGTVAGTFGYMAPEQLAGEATPASDVYGVGALAVALLTRKDPRQLLDHAGRLRFEGYLRVRGPTRELLRRMLDPDPSRRPRDGAAVLDAIDALGDGRPLPALPELPVRTTSAPPEAMDDGALRASPYRVFAIVVGLLTMAGGVMAIGVSAVVIGASYATQPASVVAPAAAQLSPGTASIATPAVVWTPATAGELRNRFAQEALASCTGGGPDGWVHVSVRSVGLSVAGEGDGQVHECIEQALGNVPGTDDVWIDLRHPDLELPTDACERQWHQGYDGLLTGVRWVTLDDGVVFEVPGQLPASQWLSSCLAKAGQDPKVLAAFSALGAHGTLERP